MTRPIRPDGPFNVVLAPSKSRRQIPMDQLRADLLQAKLLMGESGVAGFTEISHGNAKALFSSLFGRLVGLKRSDCPITWTADFVKVDGGAEYGAAAIAVVAPIRRTVWVRLRRFDGLRVGMVAAHLHPGGFARRPSRAQRLVRPLIQRRWRRHAARIQRRLDWLAQRCDVVVMVGDINRPDSYTWDGLMRRTGPGLLYVGVAGDGDRNPTRFVAQHADHKAVVVPVTP
ncbi:MAG TPA: hypothetical protein VN088_06250 [Nocardioides sp.]|nr:hypothetical protein [Nocardioides sp.]